MTQASRAAPRLPPSWCPGCWLQLLVQSAFSSSCFSHYKSERWRPPSSCGLNEHCHHYWPACSFKVLITRNLQPSTGKARTWPAITSSTDQTSFITTGDFISKQEKLDNNINPGMRCRCFSFPPELLRTEEFNLLGTSVATEVFVPAKTATRKQEHPAECRCLQTEIDTADKKP